MLSGSLPGQLEMGSPYSWLVLSIVFIVLVVAVAAFLGCMYSLYWMIRNRRELSEEGTPRIERAVGKHGTVYVTIPPEESGAGKIQLNLQNQTMEYLALTSGHRLAPGAKVVITDVVDSNTVQVEPVLETERSNHV